MFSAIAKAEKFFHYAQINLPTRTMLIITF